MPPQQCPECRRFLKNDFVTTLTSEPTSCPRCGTGLIADMFALGAAGANGASAPPEAPAASGVEAGATGPDPVDPDTPVTGDGEPSVRPPDLRPDRVRDAPGEVLAGWDRGTGPAEVVDRAPFPLDAVVLAGAGLVGALLGTLFGDRGCRGAVLGAGGGVFGAALARRVWRLE